MLQFSTLKCRASADLLSITPVNDVRWRVTAPRATINVGGAAEDLTRLPIPEHGMMEEEV